MWGNTASAPLRRCRTSAEQIYYAFSCSTSSVTWSSPSWTATRTDASAATSTPKAAGTPDASRYAPVRTVSWRVDVAAGRAAAAHAQAKRGCASVAVVLLCWSSLSSSGATREDGGAQTRASAPCVASFLAADPLAEPLSSSSDRDSGTPPLTSFLFSAFLSASSFAFRALQRQRAPSAVHQNFGPDIQKDIDTVKDDCFQCRAAAARRVPA